MKKTVSALVVAAALMAAALPAQQPQFRGIYVPSFDTNTQARCDAVIADVLNSNLNQVFVQVRSRADASYFPNREDDTYPNGEPRGQLYTLSPADLDVLQYYIDRLHNANPPRKVVAWLTTYNSWNRVAPPASPAHVFNTNPEWITENRAGTTFTSANDAPLDPGIPEVQDYLYNVFMDVVRNYDIDGIHFDYIRLLGADSGFDPVAKAAFQAQTGWNFDTQNTGGALEEVYEAWRRDQIAKLVQRVHDQTMLEKPWVETSAFLVNFSDSVELLGQGYNWWVANNAIDVLYPGCYDRTVSGTVGDWNFYINKLAQNGDQNKRPVVAAIGSYLFLEAGDGARNLQSIAQLETNARRPDGYVFFANGALFRDGSPVPDQLARDLFNPGGPMDTFVPVPSIPHKVPLGEEFVPPNPPANVAVSLVSGKPQVTFSRPAPASDGDLPVRYRLYRDTKPAVDLYYRNMAMEWWDVASARTSFSHVDVLSPNGNVWYAVVAYDDWNNRAVTTVGPVAAAGADYIVETRAGGRNFGDYSEPSGSFTNSSSHSTAEGCTPEIGSRFVQASNAADRDDIARFTPSVPTGTYDVFVTCFGFASANAENITVRMSDATGVHTSTTSITNASAGNKWLPVGKITITGGAGHFVEFDNATQSNIGAGGGWRMNAAATRFVRSDVTPTPKERKPAVVPRPSNVTEVIVDSTPQALNYDDDGTSGKWANSFLLGYYNSNARFYSNNNFPMNATGVWIVDLPRQGRWAIDGWVRNNNSFATGAQYRFVDGSGTVRNVSTTQRTGSESQTTGGWFINVDGVTDNNAYQFNKGRVYVTVHGNTAGAQTVIADALRFRLIEATGNEEDDGWMIY